VLGCLQPVAGGVDGVRGHCRKPNTERSIYGIWGWLSRMMLSQNWLPQKGVKLGCGERLDQTVPPPLT